MSSTCESAPPGAVADKKQRKKDNMCKHWKERGLDSEYADKARNPVVLCQNVSELSALKAPKKTLGCCWLLDEGGRHCLVALGPTGHLEPLSPSASARADLARPSRADQLCLVAFSRGSSARSHVAAVLASGAVVVWDTRHPSRPQTLGSVSGARSVAVAPDGSCVCVVRGEQPRVALWRRSAPAARWAPDELTADACPADATPSFFFAPGQAAAVCTLDVALSPAPACARPWSLALPSATAHAWDPCGSLLAVAARGPARLAFAREGAGPLLVPLSHVVADGVGRLAWSHDGLFVFLATEGGEVLVASRLGSPLAVARAGESGPAVRVCEGPVAPWSLALPSATAHAWDPCGSLLAVAARGPARLAFAREGAGPLLVPLSHVVADGVGRLAWSHDGLFVFLATEGGEVLVASRLGSPLAVARAGESGPAVRVCEGPVAFLCPHPRRPTVAAVARERTLQVALDDVEYIEAVEQFASNSGALLEGGVAEANLYHSWRLVLSAPHTVPLHLLRASLGSDAAVKRIATRAEALPEIMAEAIGACEWAQDAVVASSFLMRLTVVLFNAAMARVAAGRAAAAELEECAGSASKLREADAYVPEGNFTPQWLQLLDSVREAERQRTQEGEGAEGSGSAGHVSKIKHVLSALVSPNVRGRTRVGSPGGEAHVQHPQVRLPGPRGSPDYLVGLGHVFYGQRALDEALAHYRRAGERGLFSLVLLLLEKYQVEWALYEVLAFLYAGDGQAEQAAASSLLYDECKYCCDHVSRFMALYMQSKPVFTDQRPPEAVRRIWLSHERVTEAVVAAPSWSVLNAVVLSLWAGRPATGCSALYYSGYWHLALVLGVVHVREGPAALESVLFGALVADQDWDALAQYLLLRQRLDAPESPPFEPRFQASYAEVALLLHKAVCELAARLQPLPPEPVREAAPTRYWGFAGAVAGRSDDDPLLVRLAALIDAALSLFLHFSPDVARGYLAAPEMQQSDDLRDAFRGVVSAAWFLHVRDSAAVLIKRGSRDAELSKWACRGFQSPKALQEVCLTTMAACQQTEDSVDTFALYSVGDIMGSLHDKFRDAVPEALRELLAARRAHHAGALKDKRHPEEADPEYVDFIRTLAAHVAEARLDAVPPPLRGGVDDMPALLREWLRACGVERSPVEDVVLGGLAEARRLQPRLEVPSLLRSLMSQEALAAELQSPAVTPPEASGRPPLEAPRRQATPSFTEAASSATDTETADFSVTASSEELASSGRGSPALLSSASEVDTIAAPVDSSGAQSEGASGGSASDGSAASSSSGQPSESSSCSGSSASGTGAGTGAGGDGDGEDGHRRPHRHRHSSAHGGKHRSRSSSRSHSKKPKAPICLERERPKTGQLAGAQEPQVSVPPLQLSALGPPGGGAGEGGSARSESELAGQHEGLGEQGGEESEGSVLEEVEADPRAPDRARSALAGMENDPVYMAQHELLESSLRARARELGEAARPRGRAGQPAPSEAVSLDPAREEGEGVELFPENEYKLLAMPALAEHAILDEELAAMCEAGVGAAEDGDEAAEPQGSDGERQQEDEEQQRRTWGRGSQRATRAAAVVRRFREGDEGAEEDQRDAEGALCAAARQSRGAQRSREGGAAPRAGESRGGTAEVRLWLRGVSPAMEQYAEAFEREGYETVEQVALLTLDEVKELGVRMAHRRALADAIRRLRLVLSAPAGSPAEQPALPCSPREEQPGGDEPLADEPSMAAAAASPQGPSEQRRGATGDVRAGYEAGVSSEDEDEEELPAGDYYPEEVGPDDAYGRTRSPQSARSFSGGRTRAAAAAGRMTLDAADAPLAWDAAGDAGFEFLALPPDVDALCGASAGATDRYIAFAAGARAITLDPLLPEMPDPQEPRVRLDMLQLGPAPPRRCAGGQAVQRSVSAREFFQRRETESRRADAVSRARRAAQSARVSSAAAAAAAAAQGMAPQGPRETARPRRDAEAVRQLAAHARSVSWRGAEPQRPMRVSRDLEQQRDQRQQQQRRGGGGGSSGSGDAVVEKVLLDRRRALRERVLSAASSAGAGPLRSGQQRGGAAAPRSPGARGRTEEAQRAAEEWESYLRSRDESRRLRRQALDEADSRWSERSRALREMSARASADALLAATPPRQRAASAQTYDAGAVRCAKSDQQAATRDGDGDDDDVELPVLSPPGESDDGLLGVPVSLDTTGEGVGGSGRFLDVSDVSAAMFHAGPVLVPRRSAFPSALEPQGSQRLQRTDDSGVRAAEAAQKVCSQVRDDAQRLDARVSALQASIGARTRG
eukprot:m51a1_g959 hypothetical protein (2276) ;mRNA; f:318250-327808